MTDIGIIAINIACYLIPLIFVRACVIGYWWFKLAVKGRTYGWTDFYGTIYEKNPNYFPGWESEYRHPMLMSCWGVVCWVPLVNIFVTVGWLMMFVIWGVSLSCLWLVRKCCDFYDRHEHTIHKAHFCWWRPFSRFAWKVTYPVRTVIAGICEGILWCRDRYRNIRITR